MTTNKAISEATRLTRRAVQQAVQGVLYGSSVAWRLPVKTDDDCIAELLTVFDEDEVGEIFRLCKACGALEKSLDYYIAGAVADVKLGFSKDFVRYELYQTCMAPRDELKTDTPEEQFFK